MPYEYDLLLVVELIYEPSKWHACKEVDWQTCTLAANCYAYVLNRPDYYWAVPGLGYARTEARHFFASYDSYFENVTQSELKSMLFTGATHDGLLQVDEPTSRRGHYLLALFFASDDLDFHWYRKDDNGAWSHKNGWHAVSNTDSHGRVIHDPRDDTASDYPVFGSFFLAPREGIVLEQRFPLVSR